MKLDFLNLLKPKAATIPTGGYEGATRYTPDRSYIYNTYDVNSEVESLARDEILRITRYLVNNFSVMERILTLSLIHI